MKLLLLLAAWVCFTWRAVQKDKEGCRGSVAMPVLKAMDPVMAYRTLRMTESSNPFSQVVSDSKQSWKHLGYRGSSERT